MTALPKRYFTPEEYLLLEDQAEYKSQYVDGEIFAMAGAEPEHVEITDNLTFALRTRFRGRPCRSYASEIKVRVEPGGLWTYPDVVALCGEARFDRTGAPASLLNPQVIFEVLSPNTASFDRGDKFTRYQRLASLTDYLLIAVEQMRVDHYVRQGDNEWKLTIHTRPDQAIFLVSVDCELPLAEIYERVTFPIPQPQGRALRQGD